MPYQKIHLQEWIKINTSNSTAWIEIADGMDCTPWNGIRVALTAWTSIALSITLYSSNRATDRSVLVESLRKLGFCRRNGSWTTSLNGSGQDRDDLDVSLTGWFTRKCLWFF